MLTHHSLIAVGMLLVGPVVTSRLDKTFVATARADERQYEAVIVVPAGVDTDEGTAWKRVGFRGVVLMVDEQPDEAILHSSA